MKIAVISTPIFQMCPPTGTAGYSGLEALAWTTAKGLAEKGHEVLLIGPDGSTCSGARVLGIGPAGQVNERQAYDKYRGELLGMDCIVDHSWMKWSYQAKAEGITKAPVLGVLHAPCNTMYSRWPPAFDGLPPVQKACPVCISKDQAAHFEALHETPARVAYNGVDPEVYKPIPGVKRTKRFLFLARFSTVKSPHLAIEACQKAGVGLDLVGDTSITNEPDYLERCRRMCDGEQIRMVGGVSRGDCVKWFSQAHCLIHPNRDFREPMGLAPVEAMMCGCPVIGWRRGALMETVQYDKNKSDWTGRLVSSEQELASAVGRMAVPPPKDWIGASQDVPNRERCREWAVSNFSVDKMVSRYASLCEEAVRTGGW